MRGLTRSETLRIGRWARQPWAERLGVPLGPIAILVTLVIVFTVSQQNFFGVASFRAIGANAAIVFVFAVGETLVILTGRIDLSIGGIASLTTVLLPKFIPSLGWAAIPAVILLFAIAGIAQGLLHFNLAPALVRGDHSRPLHMGWGGARNLAGDRGERPLQQQPDDLAER